MLTEPLPNLLDVRKAAVRGLTISGVLKPQKLKRLRELLAGDEGNLEVVLSFSQDEEKRYLIAVSVKAELTVVCQRCLAPMPLELATDNALAVVWDDELARNLPRRLDPLILGEGPCNLWELVEEELILSLPAYNYHQEQDCNELLIGLSQPPPEDVGEGEKPNPFNVLAQLKPGNKH